MKSTSKLKLTTRDIKLLGIALLGSITLAMSNANPTAQEILKKAEQKLAASSMIATLDIAIQRPRWNKTMRMKTWTIGTDYALAYILAPDKDKGTVYLKNKENVYNYLPKIKKTIKLPATLLSQNWMGTDMSTDDLVKLTKLTEDYTAKVSGSQTISGRLCYEITLIPKPTADVLWGKIVTCIDQKDYIQLKSVFYDEDLEVVNTMVGSEIKNLGGKMMASKMIMTPAGKSGHSTTVTYNSITFNQKLATSFFAKENLPRVTP